MIYLYTFGSVELKRDGADVTSVLHQPKRLALLVYLATAHPRGHHSRDTLLALFWPDSDQEQARNALRQALFYLRRSLGDGVVVGRGDREVGAAPERLWADAAAFDDLLSEGRSEEALALYRGEFLGGFFVEDAPEVERWLDGERVRRRRAAVEAAWDLAGRDEAAGDVASAARWARTAASLAPQDEPSLRRLLALHERAGQPAEAVERFERYARDLEREYGLAPSPETLALVERIRAPAPAAAPARSEPPVPPPPPPSLAAPSPPPRRGAFGWRSAATALALAVLLAVGGGELRRAVRGVPAQVPATAPVTLAVLPFLDLGSGPEGEYFADGVSEELLSLLARMPGLRVVARTSSFSFRGTALPVDSIGRALRAQYVLEGSVRREGDRVRVLAHLVEAETGYLLWNGSFEGGLSDVLGVQEEIGRAIGDQLRIRLAAGSAGAPARRAGHDPEAYLLTMKGRYLRHRAGTAEGHAQAASFFEQAIARDPAHAPAHAGLAEVLLAQVRRRFIEPGDGYGRAAAAVRTALEHDPELATAHAAASRIAEVRDWDFRAARMHAERAITLDPSDVGARLRHAGLLLRQRRFEQAVSAAEGAVELDPVSSLAHSHLAWAYLGAGRSADALRAMQAALDLSPGDGISLVQLAVVYAELGRFPEALHALEQGLSRVPDDPWALAYAVQIHATAGRDRDARSALRSLQALPGSPAYLRAAAHAALGDADEAFRLLEVAVEGREDLVPDLAMDRSFDPLRDDPRMGRLLATIGFR